MAASLVTSELATRALIARYFGPAAAAAVTSLSSAAPRMAQAHAPAGGGSTTGPLLAHELINPGQPRGGVPAFAGGASGPIRFLSMFGRKSDRIDPILAAAFSSTSEL